MGYIPPPSGSRVTQGLIAYWIFDEKSGNIVVDQIGSTDLTLSGDYSWLTGTNGLFVTNGRGVAPGTEIITALKASNRFTLEVWVEPANLTQTGPARIFAITQDPSYHNMHLGQYTNDTVTGGVSLRINKRVGGTNTYVTDANLTLNMTHLVYVFDGTDKLLYINGALHGTYPAAADPAIPLILADSWTDTDMIVIANENNPEGLPDNDRPYTGLYKQIALYNRVLTQEEVTINYNVGANIIEGIMPPDSPTNIRFEQ